MILLITSKLLFAAACIWLLFSNSFKKHIFGRSEYTGLRKTVVCSLMLMVSIYFIFLFVNKNAYLISDCGEEMCRSFNYEMLFNSFFGMLQAFTLDVSYEQFVSDLKNILIAMGQPEWKCVCIAIYSYIVFVCAPIAGGFIVFEAIASVFPRLLGALSLVRIGKDIIYFSELNERSITFAKSIVENSCWYKRPILIFTDAYSDDKKEKDTELILSAKSIGAICINDDILHIHLRRTHFRKLGKKQIFLIDNNEESNLQTLAQMTDSKYSGFLKWTEIFLFAEHDVSSFLEKVIEARLKESIENIYSKQIERKKRLIINSTETGLNSRKNELSELIPKLEKIKDNTGDFTTKERIKERIDKLSIEKNDIDCMLGLLTEKKDIIWDKQAGKDDVNDDKIKILKDLQKMLFAKVNGFINNDLMPDIKLISGKRNIIINLLKEKPLFEPLVAKGIKPPAYETEKYPLNVTIVGAGQLGTEAFLTTYWSGQLLNCDLTINVISKEKEDEFKNKIDFINPQILKTSEKEKDISLLKIYNDQHKDIAESYFDFNYIQANIRGDIESSIVDLQSRSKVKESTESVKNVLESSDYIIVTLGSDEENIIFADRIKQMIKISNLCNNLNRKVLIAYAVYNSEICEALNKKSLDETGNIYMYAFASLKEIYSFKNIYMQSSYDESEDIHSSYDARIKDIIDENRNKVKQNKKTSYDYWADVARANHIEYKVFSAGIISKSIFDSTVDDNQLKESRNDDLREYKKMFRWDYKNNHLNPEKIIEQYRKKGIDFDDLSARELGEILVFDENNKCNEERLKLIKDLYDKLAWLEHRRWNAFMRVNGFVAPENFYTLLEKNKSHKNMSLKLHSCIVECSKNGITEKLLENCNTDGLDLLDSISVEVMKSGINKPYNLDYKVYDYPEYDFKCNENGEIIE